ncbi:MAG TPA: cation transporter dimerization domain-containing protein, partial [Desulfitobacteriaceae bacterium]|nr:cation transporter dimerization domain-containing protein [Desulfitobacteriaceae bacterium]
YLDFPLDGLAGSIIALLIIYTGFKIAKATVNVLLGTPPDPELVKKITALVMGSGYIDEMRDLKVHDYGPGRIMASLRVEVGENIEVGRTHFVIDELEKNILKELGIEIIIHADSLANGK